MGFKEPVPLNSARSRFQPVWTRQLATQRNLRLVRAALRCAPRSRHYAVWLAARSERQKLSNRLTDSSVPRLPRVVLPGVALHLTQRGNNRAATFRAPDDYVQYRDALLQANLRAGCHIHAYVLMTNHVHLLLTPVDPIGPARLMHTVNTAYVRYANQRYGRTGSLWEGRYRSALVDSDRYLLVCSRYIELNPVRACMVKHPAAYPWSSYRHNADGVPDPLLTPHSLYLSLESDAIARRSAYRALFDDALDVQTLEAIRAATYRGAAIGDGHFEKAMRVQSQPRRLPLQHGGDRRSKAFHSSRGRAS